MSDVSPTSLYQYFDSADVLLYVGITGRGQRRNAEHARTKDWWPFVARQQVEHFASRCEAEEREAEMIRTLRPPFNYAHNPTPNADAYVMTRQAVAETESFGSFIARRGSKLPALIAAQDGQNVVILSHPDCWPALRAVRYSRRARIVAPTGECFGHVGQLETVGYVLRLIGKVRKGVVVESPQAEIRLRIDTKAQRADLRSVIANLADT